MVRNPSKKVLKQSGKFTNSLDLQNQFFANGEERRNKGDKKDSDSGYWNGGRCNWGGSHNLQEDCETLANFFNEVASIANDVSEIKLAVNEQIFNQKKQALIDKIKSLNNKCQVSKSCSIANICCIWNDYFGSFLKPFLDNFSSKLAKQINEVIKLEPKHQKEILELEKQAQELQSTYDDNVRKANDPNTSPEQKTKFLLLADEAANKAKALKSKIKANPLADLSRFSNLDDLNVLLKGNITKKAPSSNKSSGSGSNSSQNTSNSNQNSTNPENNQQLLIFAGIVLLIIFYFYTQKEEENYHF